MQILWVILKMSDAFEVSALETKTYVPKGVSIVPRRTIEIAVEGGREKAWASMKDKR